MMSRRFAPPGAIIDHDHGSMRSILVLLAVLTLAGCAGLVSRPLGERVEAGLLNSDDPRLVAEGIPAYLILVEGGLARDPDDGALLLAAARLYGAYAGVSQEGDRQRGAALAAKAFAYAERALCASDRTLCGLQALPFDQFEARLAQLRPRQAALLFTYASAWAGYIQAHSHDWTALADLPKVEAALARVVALDPDHQRGLPHLYLGVLAALRPPALGGDPDKARRHFERAIALSDGQNLMAKVEYARRYARLTFDQRLHDRLLDEVLAADPHAPDLTLINVLAQREARRLRAESAEYFEE